MFDSHCHLTTLLEQSSSNNSELISLASSNFELIANSNHQFLCVTTHSQEWSDAIKLRNQYSNVYAAVGIHPWFVNSNWQNDLLILNNFVNNNDVSAIGEIGLDFSPLYRNNREQQIDCFLAQLTLAEDSNKPVSLHVVKAHNETLQLLKTVDVTGVVHGIGTSIQMAESYVNLGYKLGVNGVAVRDNAVRYHQLIKHFGIEHIVLETDFPNINLPNKSTSELNDIFHVAQFVGQQLNLSQEQVITITYKNARSVFKLTNEN